MDLMVINEGSDEWKQIEKKRGNSSERKHGEKMCLNKY